MLSKDAVHGRRVPVENIKQFGCGMHDSHSCIMQWVFGPNEARSFKIPYPQAHGPACQA